MVYTFIKVWKSWDFSPSNVGMQFLRLYTRPTIMGWNNYFSHRIIAQLSADIEIKIIRLGIT